MSYRERATSVPGVVLWRHTFSATESARILSDGCLDLLWDGHRLFVAGPDTAARWHQTSARVSYVALRLSGGTGPGLAWALERAAVREVDPLGPRVLAMASAGTPVAVMAHRLGLSAPHLHRRCLPVFGYGPRRLARVLRLGRALDQARTGAPLAQVAAGCGYVDQAHLSREVRALAGTTPTGLLRELGRS